MNIRTPIHSHLNCNFLEERQYDVSTFLRRNWIVELEIRTDGFASGNTEEERTLQSVLRDQNLDSVLADEQDVAGFVTDLTKQKKNIIITRN